MRGEVSPAAQSGDRMMVTDKEKLACAEREVKMRQRVYPTWVTSGRMRQVDADREIATMQAIADDYRSRATEDLFS